MNHNYDINVRYDVLCAIKDKLFFIDHGLESSVLEMKNGLIQSEVFLAGNQFEKAKKTTNACIDITNKTRSNISHATEYIEELKKIIDEYGKCTYSEG